MLLNTLYYTPILSGHPKVSIMRDLSQDIHHRCRRGYLQRMHQDIQYLYVALVWSPSWSDIAMCAVQISYTSVFDMLDVVLSVLLNVEVSFDSHTLASIVKYNFVGIIVPLAISLVVFLVFRVDNCIGLRPLC